MSATNEAPDGGGASDAARDDGDASDAALAERFRRTRLFDFAYSLRFELVAFDTRPGRPTPGSRRSAST